MLLALSYVIIMSFFNTHYLHRLSHPERIVGRFKSKSAKGLSLGKIFLPAFRHMSPSKEHLKICSPLKYCWCSKVPFRIFLYFHHRQHMLDPLASKLPRAVVFFRPDSCHDFFEIERVLHSIIDIASSNRTGPGSGSEGPCISGAKLSCCVIRHPNTRSVFHIPQNESPIVGIGNNTIQGAWADGLNWDDQICLSLGLLPPATMSIRVTTESYDMWRLLQTYLSANRLQISRCSRFSILHRERDRERGSELVRWGRDVYLPSRETVECKDRI